MVEVAIVVCVVGVAVSDASVVVDAFEVVTHLHRGRLFFKLLFLRF